MEINITINETQAQQLLTLIDAAVRAQGLQAALVATPLHDLIQRAAEAARPKENQE